MVQNCLTSICWYPCPFRAFRMAELDEDRGPKILGVLWALTGLTTLIVTARMFIRGKMLHNLGLDDWLIALSMVSLFFFSALF